MTKTIYCTIAAANYLPQVQVLRDSLRKHGHFDFRLLLIEHPATVAKLRSQLPDYQILGPDEVGCPQWLHMAFYYDVMEYSTALKPALIRHLLAEGNVVYLDPDIEVFSPLTEIEELLQGNDIVVTPHICKPLPEDGKKPSVRRILQQGQFNLGFIGVRSEAENQALMDWWQGVLIEGAACDAIKGTFTDQFWAAALVSFARRTSILRSARYNLAYWNVGQHKLTWNGLGTPETEDGPLGFYHYSGLSRQNLSSVSRYQDRITAKPGTPLYLLLGQYLTQLEQSPLSQYAATPYSFARYADHSPVLSEHRRAFGLLPEVNRRQVANPFVEPALTRRLCLSSPRPVEGDLVSALSDAQLRIRQLEQRLSSLPYSLFDHMQFAMDRVAPGSWDRMYGLLQRVSHQLGPRMANLRHLIS